ncbi:MAG TPA: SDR family oxidoreductase, partial [Mycobacterium sp.]|nr:SDR family oxidoreductase [Mycobacterium sp.]
MTAAARRTMPLTFSGGTAVVTGAAAGIGAAIARSLMSAGIRTVRLDVRTPERDKDFDAAVQVCVGADVRDRGVAQLLTAAGAPVDDISYLVNCAGVLDNTGFSGVDRDTWMRCLEINLVGAYNMIDALGPALRGAQAGAVVNITSIEASRIVALTDPDPTPQYAASKAGLLMLTKSAARALAADG